MPGTKGFRYVYAPAQINKLLNKVQSTGRPDKLTFPYIRDTWLLKNKQYQEVISLLKDMEFLDSSSVPTKLYAEYQNPSAAKQALAKGIQNAYPELFKAYPNAQSLPKPELEGYFRQQTGKAGSVLDKILSTFLALCSKADFAGVGVAPEEPPPKYRREGAEEGRVKVEPKIQLNIEIHIAPDTPDDKIETIFKNMKKYLLPNE
jgi:hypothetical protein